MNLIQDNVDKEVIKYSYNQIVIFLSIIVL
jgi:hypothetical protein